MKQNNSPKPATAAAAYVQDLVSSSPKTIGQRVLEGYGVGNTDANTYLRNAGAQPGQSRDGQPGAGRTASAISGKTAKA